MTGRVLIAGVGNIFLSDDGFGVEVIRRLQERGGLPDGVEIVDVGIRGRDLAYQLLDGYRTLVIVDATQRGGAPGTIYTLEHDLDAPRNGEADLGGHSVDPLAMLDLLNELATSMGIERPVDRVLVVGCEPGMLDEAMGLSAPVAAAVEPALELIVDLANHLSEVRILTREGTSQ